MIIPLSPHIYATRHGFSSVPYIIFLTIVEVLATADCTRSPLPPLQTAELTTFVVLSFTTSLSDLFCLRLRLVKSYFGLCDSLSH